MPSFDRKSERPPAARFLDVTEGKLRAPSWVASQRSGQRRASDPSFKAPRIPSDFRILDVASAAPVADRVASLSAAPEALGSRSRGPGAKSVTPSQLTSHETAGEEVPSRIQPLSGPVVEPDETLVRAFLNAVDGLGEARALVLEDSVREVTELVTTIARRVIARELSLDPTIVEGLVEEGLAALGREDRMTVRLGARFARAAGAIERRLTVGDQRVEIILDPTLEPHGCIVETDLGRVDESIESRLSALLSALESDSPPQGA